MSGRSRTCLKRALSALFAAALLSSHAAAADNEDDARMEAKGLAERGDEAFSTGRCDQAIPLWRQADLKFHAPTITLRIARCQSLLGRVVEATATLESIVNEKLPADAPEPFRDAQRRAAAELPSVRARIATVEVLVDRRGVPAEATIDIDGRSWPRGQTRTYIDPGTHLVRVRAEQGQWERRIQVPEGSTQVVRAALTLEQPPEPARTQRTVGYILGGAGLGTMAVGSYLGLRAVSIANDLEDVCGPNLNACPPARQGDIDELRTMARAADFTLAAGGVLFLAGAVVIFTEAPPAKEKPRVRVMPMGMGASLHATF